MKNTDALDKQIKEKVVPYCKDKEIPFIAVTPGTTFILGSQADLATTLGHLFESMLEKNVFNTEQILAIFAVAKTRTASEEEEDED